MTVFKTVQGCTSREGQSLLNLYYKCGISDTTLAEIIKIVKDPHFKAGMYFFTTF